MPVFTLLLRACFPCEYSVSTVETEHTPHWLRISQNFSRSTGFKFVLVLVYAQRRVFAPSQVYCYTPITTLLNLRLQLGEMVCKHNSC